MERQIRYGIRKFTVGVASCIIGMFMYGNAIHAQTASTVSNTADTTAVSAGAIEVEVRRAEIKSKYVMSSDITQYRDEDGVFEYEDGMRVSENYNSSIYAYNEKTFVYARNFAITDENGRKVVTLWYHDQDDNMGGGTNDGSTVHSGENPRSNDSVGVTQPTAQPATRDVKVRYEAYYPHRVGNQYEEIKHETVSVANDVDLSTYNKSLDDGRYEYSHTVKVNEYEVRQIYRVKHGVWRIIGHDNFNDRYFANYKEAIDTLRREIPEGYVIDRVSTTGARYVDSDHDLSAIKLTRLDFITTTDRLIRMSGFDFENADWVHVYNNDGWRWFLEYTVDENYDLFMNAYPDVDSGLSISLLNYDHWQNLAEARDGRYFTVDYSYDELRDDHGRVAFDPSNITFKYIDVHTKQVVHEERGVDYENTSNNDLHTKYTLIGVDRSQEATNNLRMYYVHKPGIHIVDTNALTLDTPIVETIPFTSDWYALTANNLEVLQEKYKGYHFESLTHTSFPRGSQLPSYGAYINGSLYVQRKLYKLNVILDKDIVELGELDLSNVSDTDTLHDIVMRQLKTSSQLSTSGAAFYKVLGADLSTSYSGKRKVVPQSNWHGDGVLKVKLNDVLRNLRIYRLKVSDQGLGIESDLYESYLPENRPVILDALTKDVRWVRSDVVGELIEESAMDNQPERIVWDENLLGYTGIYFKPETLSLRVYDEDLTDTPSTDITTKGNRFKLWWNGKERWVEVLGYKPENNASFDELLTDYNYVGDTFNNQVKLFVPKADFTKQKTTYLTEDDAILEESQNGELLDAKQFEGYKHIETINESDKSGRIHVYRKLEERAKPTEVVYRMYENAEGKVHGEQFDSTNADELGAQEVVWYDPIDNVEVSTKTQGRPKVVYVNTVPRVETREVVHNVIYSPDYDDDYTGVRKQEPEKTVYEKRIGYTLDDPTRPDLTEHVGEERVATFGQDMIVSVGVKPTVHHEVIGNEHVITIMHYDLDRQTGDVTPREEVVRIPVGQITKPEVLDFHAGDSHMEVLHDLYVTGYDVEYNGKLIENVLNQTLDGASSQRMESVIHYASSWQRGDTVERWCFLLGEDFLTPSGERVRVNDTLRIRRRIGDDVSPWEEVTVKRNILQPTITFNENGTLVRGKTDPNKDVFVLSATSGLKSKARSNSTGHFTVDLTVDENGRPTGYTGVSDVNELNYMISLYVDDADTNKDALNTMEFYVYRIENGVGTHDDSRWDDKVHASNRSAPNEVAPIKLKTPTFETIYDTEREVNYDMNNYTNGKVYTLQIKVGEEIKEINTRDFVSAKQIFNKDNFSAGDTFKARVVGETSTTSREGYEELSDWIDVVVQEVPVKEKVDAPEMNFVYESMTSLQTDEMFHYGRNKTTYDMEVEYNGVTMMFNDESIIVRDFMGEREVKLTDVIRVRYNDVREGKISDWVNVDVKNRYDAPVVTQAVAGTNVIWGRSEPNKHVVFIVWDDELRKTMIYETTTDSTGEFRLVTGNTKLVSPDIYFGIGYGSVDLLGYTTDLPLADIPNDFKLGAQLHPGEDIHNLDHLDKMYYIETKSFVSYDVADDTRVKPTPPIMESVEVVEGTTVFRGTLPEHTLLLTDIEGDVQYNGRHFTFTAKRPINANETFTFYAHNMTDYELPQRLPEFTSDGVDVRGLKAPETKVDAPVISAWEYRTRIYHNVGKGLEVEYNGRTVTYTAEQLVHGFLHKELFIDNPETKNMDEIYWYTNDVIRVRYKGDGYVSDWSTVEIKDVPERPDVTQAYIGENVIKGKGMPNTYVFVAHKGKSYFDIPTDNEGNFSLTVDTPFEENDDFTIVTMTRLFDDIPGKENIFRNDERHFPYVSILRDHVVKDRKPLETPVGEIVNGTILLSGTTESNKNVAVVVNKTDWYHTVSDNGGNFTVELAKPIAKTDTVVGFTHVLTEVEAETVDIDNLPPLVTSKLGVMRVLGALVPPVVDFELEKIPVVDPSHLTIYEKQKLRLRVIEAMGNLYVDGQTEIEVRDNGDVLITRPAYQPLLKTDNVFEAKNGAGEKLELGTLALKDLFEFDFEKVGVVDDTKLTDVEKATLRERVTKGLPEDVKVIITDDGVVVIRFADDSFVSLSRDKTVYKLAQNITNTVTQSSESGRLPLRRVLPKTGDTSQKLMYTGGSLVGLAGVMLLSKRRKKEDSR